MPERGRATFIEQFSGASRHVVDYLAQDVLDLLDPATRDFLLQVSVLGRFTGPLCDAVTGTTGSGAVLADLERANLFISVDSAGEWYQPHQLFTEALRVELTRTQPTLVPVLHARAAAWLEDAGDIEAATDHAIAAHDVHLASRLVAAQVQPMSATGRSANIRRWLAALAWPEALRDPELAFVRAVAASLANQLDDAADWLDVARTGDLGAVDAGGLPLGFRVDFLDSAMGVNDVGRALEAARRAVAGAPNPSWHGIALACLGQAQYLAGHGDEATATLRVAVGEITDANPIMLAFAVGNLGLAESSTGAESHADPLLDRLADVLRASAPTVRSPPPCCCSRRGSGHADWATCRAPCVELRCAIDILEDMPRSAWLADAFLLLAATERLVGPRGRCARGRRPGAGDPRPAPRPGRAGRASRRPACRAGRARAARHGVRRGAVRAGGRRAAPRRGRAPAARDRRPALHLLQHREVPPEGRLPQAGRRVAGRGDRAAAAAGRRARARTDHPGEQPGGWSVLRRGVSTMSG